MLCNHLSTLSKELCWSFRCAVWSVCISETGECHLFGERLWYSWKQEKNMVLPVWSNAFMTIMQPLCTPLHESACWSLKLQWYPFEMFEHAKKLCSVSSNVRFQIIASETAAHFIYCSVWISWTALIHATCSRLLVKTLLPQNRCRRDTVCAVRAPFPFAVLTV